MNKIKIFVVTVTMLFLSIHYLVVPLILVDENKGITKYSILWFVTFYRTEINSFPKVEPYSEISYNWLGNDAPSISKFWEISYMSNKDIDTVTSELIRIFSKENGITLKVSSQPLCGLSWIVNNADVLLINDSEETCLNITLMTIGSGETMVRMLLIE